jgi:hypothetical protein
MLNTKIIKESDGPWPYPCLYRQLTTQWIVLFNSPNYGMVIHDPDRIALGLVKTSWDLMTNPDWEEIKDITIEFNSNIKKPHL